jgi:hypothetical protein
VETILLALEKSSMIIHRKQESYRSEECRISRKSSECRMLSSAKAFFLFINNYIWVGGYVCSAKTMLQAIFVLSHFCIPGCLQCYLVYDQVAILPKYTEFEPAAIYFLQYPHEGTSKEDAFPVFRVTI